MPVYTFECPKCGYAFDEIAPMDTIPERPCQNPTEPKCDGTARRIPGMVSFKFNCSMPTYQKPKT